MFKGLIQSATGRWPWMGERGVWLVCALVFFNFAMMTLATTFVASLFLTSYGAGGLPYLYVTQAVVIMLISLSTSSLSAKHPRQFIVLGHLIAIILVILSQLSMSLSMGWIPFMSCIVLWAISQLHSINTGNFAALVFNMRKFKEYNIIFTSVGTLLGASFSFMLPLFIQDVGVRYLPLIMLFFLIAGLPIFRYLHLQQITSKASHKQEKIKVTRYPLFNNIILYLSLTIIIATLVDYCFKYSLNNNFGAAGIATFLAYFNAVTSLIVFFLQIFFTKKLMRILGVAGLLLILPAATIVTVIALMIYPTLVTATLLAAANYIVTYSMTNISREVVLNVLPTAIRLKAKSLIKGITITVGMISGSAVLWLVNKYFGAMGVLASLIVLALGAIYYSWCLQRNYKETLRQQLILKRFSPEQILLGYSDLNLLQNLVEATLKANDVRLNFLGFSMLPMASFSVLPSELKKFISSPSLELRLEAIKATKIIKDPTILQPLKLRMDQTDEVEEKFCLLEAIYQQDIKTAVEYSDQLINDTNPRLRACAINIQIKHGDINKVAYAINTLRDMIEAQDPAARAGAAEILGDVFVGDLTKELARLTNDPVEIVALNAIHSVGKRHASALIPILVDHLGKGIVGFSASKVLQGFGVEALPTLQEKLLNTNSINIGIVVIKTIASIEAPQAEKALMAIAKTNNLVVFHQIAKYSAYRAQKIEVSDEFLDHAEAMLKKVLYTITLLRFALANFDDDFHCREILARVRLVQKSFLYWLAILNNPVEMMPIVSALCAHADHNDARGFNFAIELLEASLKNTKHAPYLKQVFENEISTALTTDPIAELCALDPWLGKILSMPLTKNIGDTMDTLQIVMTLRNTNLFESLPGETLLAIAEVTKVREITAGEVIYSEGELPLAVYIIAHGECSVASKSKTLLQLKAQDCFGFIGVFENSVWDVTATAVTDGVLLYIEKAAFDQIVEDVPEVLQAMMYVVLGYLKKSLQKNLVQ